MTGEAVQIAVVSPNPAQVIRIGGVEPVGMGHDPAGDLADGGWFRAGDCSVSAPAAEAAQVALHGQFATLIAAGGDFPEQAGGVAFALVPPLVQVFDVVIDQVRALLGFGGQLLQGAGGGELADRGRVQAQLASIAAFDRPRARSSCTAVCCSRILVMIFFSGSVRTTRGTASR